MRLADVPDLAARAVRYSRGDDGNVSALILHGATSAKRDFECAVTDLLAGRAPADMSGFRETRAVALARPRDLAVGRIARGARPCSSSACLRSI